MCIEEFFVLYILYLDYIEKILCIIFYKLCIVVCIGFINLYIKLLMFYDILGFIDGLRFDVNGIVDDI